MALIKSYLWHATETCCMCLQPAWEWGYEPRNINWTVPQPNNFPVISDSEYNTAYPEYDDVNSIAYFNMYFLRPELGTDTLKGGDLFELAKHYETIYWQAGSGYTAALFENK